jgi:hypothetical protein
MGCRLLIEGYHHLGLGTTEGRCSWKQRQLTRAIYLDSIPSNGHIDIIPKGTKLRGSMKTGSIYYRFLHSKAAFPVFVAVMALLGWVFYRDIRDRLAAPLSGRSDLSFLVTGIFLLWLLPTRSFPAWRGLLGVPLFVVCALADLQALRHERLAGVSSDETFRVILWYAVFFGITLAWIVAIPIEEALYRDANVPRGRLKYWPIIFAVAGLALIAAAGIWIPSYPLGPLVQPRLNYVYAVHRAAIYLSLAFLVLAMARVILPFLPANTANKAQGGSTMVRAQGG